MRLAEGMRKMRNEIRNIRLVYKFGAFGDPYKFGTWIYGKRPDGKTVACNHIEGENGSIYIYSYKPTFGKYIEDWATEFAAEEWKLIISTEESKRLTVGNQILNARDATRP